eukprot:CAMPEP_0117554412 /NCGR_PEP_ID=MMETSP0784-20121206/50742_1 /TAXON_ID=39447 /ORGANISM="" /LENGTH=670 /DNA_ID=CAMNT_0005351579 /DNA_START=1 /DNA_END=2009 /DNA_ORIENTATION=+
MEEDAEASSGIDLLGLALSRVPGASDLDEFVDFEIYFDGTAKASADGEAMPFLRAQLCAVFEIVGTDLDRYLWHRDRFVLEVHLGEDPDRDEPHLEGHVRTGDGAEDEWFVVHLLRRLTAARGDVACRIVDSDGELLLIEAALVVPRWLDPTTAEHRCWLRGGLVHILPRPRQPEAERLPRRDALSRLRASAGSAMAKEKVQRAIEARLEGYPRRAIELSRHMARAVLPVAVARALVAFPQLVAVAVDHLPPASAQELASLQRQLVGDEASVRFDCECLSENEVVCIGVCLTRCQYARLAGLNCNLPQRFSLARWKSPTGAAPDRKAMRLGQMLCAGLETAYLQGSQGATAALRWPSPSLQDAILPPQVPWWPDDAFARHAAQCSPPVGQASLAARRAFAQQEHLDAPFREALSRMWLDPPSVDLASHWRDRDDSDEWLHVSAEEIDREMSARQAEFDEYDRRKAAAPAERAMGAASAATADQLQKELAAMGQQLSGLLERTSGSAGVDVQASQADAAMARPMAQSGDSDSDSDSDGSDGVQRGQDGGIDVLGIEDDEDSGESDEGAMDGREDAGSEFRGYMAELDEQLEGVLDAGGPQANTDSAGLPLHSHHVKVHGGDAVELDMHAMEHLLASFCSEHQLEPGPASLLLGELGLAGRGATSDAACYDA